MFDLVTSFKTNESQRNSINKIVNNFQKKINNQVLLGATGTGKTFVMANVISQLKKKTLIIVHNKTLAGQLYSEFKQFFPNVHVEYFISYFDFFQPEAYKPASDTYIEKNAQINKEIEMLRLSTLYSLARYQEVIVIASVAAIYSSSSPDDFNKFGIIFKKNERYHLKQIKYDLIKLQYKNNNVAKTPGTFGVKGDVIEIVPGYTDSFKIRLSFFGNEKHGSELEEIAVISRIDNRVLQKPNLYELGPANEYITDHHRFEKSLKRINDELNERITYFTNNNQMLQAQRIKERTSHDLESIKELGYCNGIENYAFHLELREKGSTPYTIFDYLKNDDWLLIVDESHITIPQIRGMYEGDKARKTTLVNYGFRLPSALDNRPLKFFEFEQKIKNALYVSATPSIWEKEKSNNTIIEQIIRPTGLLDPIIEIRDSNNQVNDIIEELKFVQQKNERAFITVITINMATELAAFITEKKIPVAYIHNELNTIERHKVINDLRRGKYVAIIGINLLREGLDVPEVSLVAIFDADTSGLFRSQTSLIQTIGRAARNANGRVIMYAKAISKDMAVAIDETNRRRLIQVEYNKKHHITPTTIIKPIRDDLKSNKQELIVNEFLNRKIKNTTKIKELLAKLRDEMLVAASKKEYERAAALRDYIFEIEKNNNIKDK